MQHLDEGTIHSWIDGEVDAAQSREIEAHLAQCQACSAAVAEARGLVAASSRILTALDDVPGGVVPKRAAPPVVKPAKRQWRAGAWVTGIAAALVLAIGVSELSQDKPAAFLEDEIASRRADEARQALQPIATDTARIAPVDASTRLTANQAARPQTVPTVLRPNSAPPKLADDARAGAGTDMAAPGTGRAVANAPTPAPAAPAAVTAPQVTAVAESPALQKQEQVATKAFAQEASAAAGLESRDRRTAMDLEAARFVGCYRIESADNRPIGGRVAAAAGAAARAAAARSRAVAPSATADAPTLPAPSIVRLDSARGPMGFVARNAITDVSVGSWRGVGPDSARVDMLAAGLFTFALKNRTPCPER